MTGAIFTETRPAIIIRSDWRGEPRKTSAPKRAMSKREAIIDIISMAQQAKPKLMGQMEFLRAQLMALSSVVVSTDSPYGSTSGSVSTRANSSGGWLSSNLTSSTHTIITCEWAGTDTLRDGP